MIQSNKARGNILVRYSENKQRSVTGKQVTQTRFRKNRNYERAREGTKLSYDWTVNTPRHAMDKHPGYFTEAGSRAKARTEDPSFSEEEADPDEIPFTEMPWPSSLWKMEAGWKPVFQAPLHASPLDPRAQTQIPIAERLASRLSNRKELRIFKPCDIPTERLGDRELDKGR